MTSSNDMYNTLRILRNTRGTNAKVDFLRKHPELRKVLRTTYSPFIHFNINKVNWSNFSGLGLHEFSADTNKVLNGLMRSGGREAKKAFYDHMNTLTHESALLLAGMVEKDLRLGMGATLINRALPDTVPEFPIALAHLYDPKKASWPCYVSPKLDGLRAMYMPGETPTIRSRKGFELKGLDRVMSELKKYSFRLDGELLIPGKSFQDSSGDIRSFAQSDEVVFNIFDTPDLHNESLHNRLGILLDCVKETSNIKLVPHYLVNTENGAFNLYNQFRSDGYEGAMVKWPDATYIGKRSHAWMKIKNEDTYDCKVIDVFEGTGKYAGMAGGIVIDFHGVHVRVGSGLSDVQRAIFFQDSTEIIGQTVEVACQEITPAGSMRHPRLKAIRRDK